MCAERRLVGLCIFSNIRRAYSRFRGWIICSTYSALGTNILETSRFRVFDHRCPENRIAIVNPK